MPDSIITNDQGIAIKERNNRKKSVKIKNISDDNETKETRTTSAIIDNQPGNEIQKGTTKEDENINPIVNHEDKSSTNKNKDEENDVPNNDNTEGPPRNTPIEDYSMSTKIGDATTNANDLHQHTHKYETRSKKGVRPLQYNKVFGDNYQFALILTQTSAQKEIKIFGQQYTYLFW